MENNCIINKNKYFNYTQIQINMTNFLNEDKPSAAIADKMNKGEKNSNKPNIPVSPYLNEKKF